MAWAYRGAPDLPLWAGLRQAPAVMMSFVFAPLACGYWRSPTMVGADAPLKSDGPAPGDLE